MKASRLALVLALMAVVAIIALRHTSEVRAAENTGIASTQSERPKADFVNARQQVKGNSGAMTTAPTRTVQSEKASGNPNESLPDTGSALPLLSVIGFGVLIGGLASTLKTR